jgi:hypothetical protein
MYWRKTAAWYCLSCMTLVLALALTACGDAPPTTPSNTPTIGPTNTPVIIVVEITSTPEPVISTKTLPPEPPSPTTELPAPTPEPPTSEPSTPTTMAELPTATIAVVAPTETVFAPPSPAVDADALTYQGIVQHYQSLPATQRREYEESLKGKTASDWTGWVDISRKQITTGEWELKLDMDSADPDDSSWDVRIIIPEAEASQFSRGQAVSFSGTITQVSCGSTDCDVDMRDATFTSPPTTSALPPTVVVDTPPPAPPPPTDTPLGPEASIEAGIRKYARSAELSSVEYNGTSVNIVFKVGDNITSNLRKGGAQLDVTNILRGAAEGAPADYTQVWIIGMFPLKDDFGNVEEGQVLNLRYDRATIEQINWEGFLWKNIYTIADKAIVHPDLQP